VKMIKQTLLNAILNKKGKGYVYRGALQGKKFELFAETEANDNDSGEESGEIVGTEVEETESEEDPEKRIKKKHDTRKRKATSKPSVCAPS